MIDKSKRGCSSDVSMLQEYHASFSFAISSHFKPQMVTIGYRKQHADRIYPLMFP